MICVSACLAGVKCRYDGHDNKIEKIYNMVMSGEAIPVCPEVLGGLPIPRISAEILAEHGKRIVINKNGENVTKYFIDGAEKSLAIAIAGGAKTAVLKSKSPSCGAGKIYDGSFSKILIEGNGITAELFIKNGIKVVDEFDVEEI